MKLQVKFSNRFKSDLKLAKKQNKNLDKLFLIIEKLVETEDFLYALCKVGSTKRCVIIQRYNSNADYPEFIEGYSVTFTNNNYTKEK